MRKVRMDYLWPVLLFAICAPSSEGAADTSAPWWDTAWRCRRSVVVSAGGDREPEPLVGWVSFRTGGQMKPDGADVRVIAEGQLVPHRVLFMGPGDVCKVAFEVKPSIATYHLYYGNPAASARDVNWTPRRGLLLETRRYNGGECGDWGKMQELIKQSGPVYGRGFVANVFHGHNMFGPSDAYVSIYSGWLRCPKSGEYAFITTSGDGSFLFIDGKKVVEWGSWHNPVPEARFLGKLQLERGLHRFEYYNVRRYSQPAAVAAWQLPGAAKPEVIPEYAFPRVYEGKVTGYEIYGKRIAADFEVANLGEAMVGERETIRMEFRDTTARKGATELSRTWEFGDGVKATEPVVQHVYLARGLYEIRLTVKADGEESICSHKVQVEPAWELQAKRSPEALEAHYAIVRNYELAHLIPSALAGAIAFFSAMDKPAEVAKATTLLLPKLQGLDETVAFDALMQGGKTFREKIRDLNTANRVFQAGEKHCNSATNKAKFRFEIADTELYYRNRPKEARAIFEKLLQEYGSADAYTIRLTHIRIGDTYLHEGDYENALAVYRRAREMNIEKVPFKKAAVTIGARALEVEDLLRRNELAEAYDVLSAWQWEYPEEKLRGQWSVLMARWALAKGNHQECIKQLELLLKVNQKSHYAPHALMLLAQAYDAKGEPRKAIDALETLKTDYPESPLVAEAEKELKRLTSSAEKEKQPSPREKK